MPESSQCLHNFILLIFVCNQTPLNYLTCSKRLLHWGNADWFSIYSFTPKQLTRTTTTLWIFPTLVISHHLGCWTWFPAKDANKIRSLMFAIPSGEVAHPCSTLNICWPRGTTLSCRKKNTWQDNKSCNLLRSYCVHVYIYYVDLSWKNPHPPKGEDLSPSCWKFQLSFIRVCIEFPYPLTSMKFQSPL